MKQITQWVVTGGLALCLVGSQTGCKKLAEKLAKKAVEGETAGEDSEVELEHDEVLDDLVDCINGLDHSITYALHSYSRWLPRDKDGAVLAPTGKEKSVGSFNEIRSNPTDECSKGLAAAADNAVFKDVAGKFKAITDKIVPELNAAHTYYDRKDYKDDNFEKGKTIHSTLWPLAVEFEKTSKEFHDLVTKENDARHDRLIAKVEKELGKNLLYQKLNLMRVAKDTNEIATDEEVEIDKLSASAKAYEDAFTEMETYANANKAETDKVMMWSMFDSAAEDYLKATKERVRRVRENKKYSNTEIRWINDGSGWMVDGSGAKVNKSYNTLVQRGNGLRFRY